MRFDVITIFPEFFDVLDISLLGKARSNGIVEYSIHDLRGFTHDKHRAVDDTPVNRLFILVTKTSGVSGRSGPVASGMVRSPILKAW